MIKLLKLAVFVLFALTFTIQLHAKNLTQTVKVSLRILPIMQLEVTGPADGNITFGDIQKNADKESIASAEDVYIKTTSNLAKPYTVQQELLQPIANNEGDLMPSNALVVNTTSDKSIGQGKSGVIASSNATVIYTSDSLGRSDSITAKYQVNVQPTQAAGDYASTLRYTFVTS